jgi:hypothetical protein
MASEVWVPTVPAAEPASMVEIESTLVQRTSAQCATRRLRAGWSW